MSDGFEAGHSLPGWLGVVNDPCQDGRVKATRTALWRWLALSVGVGVVALVLLTLRPPPPEPTLPPPAEGGQDPNASRLDAMVFRAFKEGRERFEIEAERWQGREQEEVQLEGVTLRFAYVSRGAPGRAVVRAASCLYNPTLQKAAFSGDVRLETEDGFALTTETLVFRGDKNRARTEDPVAFGRKDVTGTATGLVYEAEEGRLLLPADVVIRLQDPDDPPGELRSGSAELDQLGGQLRFSGGVTMTQGDDSVKAESLRIEFSEDEEVSRAKLAGGVELVSAGRAALAELAALPGGGGARRLTGQTLDLWFRPGRVLERAVATPTASLTTTVLVAGRRERRSLSGDTLQFSFDEAQRLVAASGQGGCRFDLEPLAPARETPTRIESRRFEASLDPDSGDPERVEFLRDVRMSRAGQRASGEVGVYEGAPGVLTLREQPQLEDEQRGFQLAAQTLRLHTASGDVEGEGRVMSRLRGGGQGGVFTGAAGEPVVITATGFAYDGDSGVAVYRGEAVLRSGEDQVSSDSIRIAGDAGRRRLEARGGVESVFQSRAEPAKTGAAGAASEAVRARASEMVYDEAARTIVYTGEVALQQGDIRTRSPRATVSLAAAGSRVEQLVAGEPVDVVQGPRTASGRVGTYHPADGTLHLTGEGVVLREPGREIRGRSLMFRVGDEKILVEGGEEVRTETVFQQGPPKP